MKRKQKLIQYFNNNVVINFHDIEKIRNYSDEEIQCMGGVKSWYLDCCAATHDEIKAAIEYAGYKYPNSDSVWARAIEECKKITEAKLCLAGIY